MANTDPEELGKSLAKTVDKEALYAESTGESTDELLAEILQSFKFQFQENQQGVQHELLDTVFHDELNSRHISPESMTKDGLLSTARNYARDVLHEYASTLITDGSVSYSDLPAETSSIFSFRAAIVDGYWKDTAQEIIEEYADEE